MSNYFISFTLLFLLTGCAGSDKKFEDISYIKEEEKFTEGWRTREITYTHYGDNCSFSWQVTEKRSENNRPSTFMLRDRHPLNVTCKLPFSKVKEDHQRLLAKIFADFPASRFDSLFIGTFQQFNISFQWNKDIMHRAAKSKEWETFNREYPKQKPGVSANSIYKDVFPKTEAAKELSELFSPFNLAVKLESVEKVFVGKSEDPNDQELFNRKLFFDSGIHWFRLSPLTP